MLTCCLAATEPNNSCFCIYAATTLYKSFVSFSFQGADAFKSKMNSKQIQYEEDFRKTN